MTDKTDTDKVIAFSGNTMVYESVKRFALRGLNDRMRVLMENVDDALFELSEKVENDRERTMYFDAMREIRLKRKTIEQEFDNQLKSSFDQLLLERKSKEQEFDIGELSLVDQREIEDNLAIDNMIAKARPHFEDDLYAVKERLRTVLHRKSIKDDDNPLDPRAICSSFHHASNVLDANIEVKLVFYKLFDRYVMTQLGSFYVEMNQYFIEKGVLPELKAAEERMSQTTRFMQRKIHNLPESDATPPVESGSSKPGDAAPTDEGGGLLGALRQLLLPSTPVSGGVGGPVAGSTASGAAAGAVDGAAGGGSVSGTPRNEYLGQLTSLQTSAVPVAPVLQVDAQQYRGQIQQQIGEFRQQHLASFSEADGLVIDVISMLFDFFFDDEALPDPVKVLIGRLQIPILKAAILDSHFFEQKKHPARRLLDNISRAALGWGEDHRKEQRLIDKIEQVVDFLLNEFEQDVAVFQVALEDFQQFLEDENERIEQTRQQLEQEQQEKEQQRSAAQQRVHGFINKLETRYELSLPVLDFLGGVWTNVMVSTVLSEGDDSESFVTLKKLSSTLVWTLIPKNSKPERKKLLTTLPPLLRALARGMDLIHIDAEQQNRVFKMLVLEHAKVMKQTSKNIVTRLDDETVYPEENLKKAFAGMDSQEQSQSVDYILSENETGEMQVVEQPAAGSESVSNVDREETVDVIRNLEDFSKSIVNGSIRIDEEIVMDSMQQEKFQELDEGDFDDYFDHAQDIEMGDWYEFIDEDGSKINGKLTWKSNLTGKRIFTDRRGHKVREFSLNGLAAELRAGRAHHIESVSVFDRAINSLMSRVGG